MIYVSNTYQPEITVVHFQLQHGKKLFYFIAFRQINRINRKFNMSFFFWIQHFLIWVIGMCFNFYSYSRQIVFIRFISLIRLNSFIFFSILY